MNDELTEYMSNLGYKLGKLSEDQICYFKDASWVSLSEAEFWMKYDKNNKEILERFFMTSRYSENN